MSIVCTLWRAGVIIRLWESPVLRQWLAGDGWSPVTSIVIVLPSSTVIITISIIESIWGGSILCIDSCHWQQDNERLDGVKRVFCSLVLCGGIIYGAILSTALKYPILDILYEWPSCCIHGDSNFQSICSPPRECKSAKQKTKIMKLEQRNERAASFWCQVP